MYKIFVALMLCFLAAKSVVAAPARDTSQQPDLVRTLAETKWQYTYTLHQESNTIVHQAGGQYRYFLYFKYDFTYEQFLNNVVSRGSWAIHDRMLAYSFRNVPEFEIADVTPGTLVLQFRQPNSKGHFQYHFIRVYDNDAPFVKPPNELPEVIVSANVRPRKKNWWWPFGEKAVTEKKEPVFIHIELIGGGYYGGIDPVVKDYIQIKTDGRLIQEFQSVNRGLVVTKKNIPRTELEQLADFMVAQRFFDFRALYDCETALCQQRKGRKPPPVPLRLSFTYGERRKVITIPIFGRDDHNIRYVNYPKGLDNIIESIQKIAARVDYSAGS